MTAADLLAISPTTPPDAAERQRAGRFEPHGLPVGRDREDDLGAVQGGRKRRPSASRRTDAMLRRAIVKLLAREGSERLRGAVT